LKSIWSTSLQIPAPTVLDLRQCPVSHGLETYSSNAYKACKQISFRTFWIKPKV